MALLAHDAAGREVHSYDPKKQMFEVQFLPRLPRRGTCYYSLVAEGEVYDRGKILMQ